MRCTRGGWRSSARRAPRSKRSAERYIESLVDGAEETIATLRDAGADVHLVTAGIAQAIAPLAAQARHRGARRARRAAAVR